MFRVRQIQTKNVGCTAEQVFVKQVSARKMRLGNSQSTDRWIPLHQTRIGGFTVNLSVPGSIPERELRTTVTNGD